MTQITITEVKTRDELYCRYSGQSKPQGVYIGLDLEKGLMWAESDPEIGGAVPAHVWHGITRRYSFGNVPTMETANSLMEQIRPLAERVVAGAEVAWDGSNFVGKLDADAETAEDEIMAEIDRLDDNAFLAVWPVGDWFSNNTLSDLDLSADSTAEEITAMAKKLASEAEIENAFIDGDIEEYLAERVEAAKE